MPQSYLLSNRNPKVIVLLGAPGTGKGTQAALLSQRLGLRSLSTGELLRTEAKRNSAVGCQIRQILASGSLVSDELVCSVLASNLPEDGFILDGFPRTLAQAQFLDTLLSDLGLPEPEVIHLTASSASLLKRLSARRQCLKCGAIYNLLSRPSKRGRLCEIDGAALVQRDDDTEGVILHRFHEYEAMSAPLVKYYAGANYHAVNAERDAIDISSELTEIVSDAAILAA